MVCPDDLACEIEKLVAQHGDYILRLCFTVLSDKSLAEDAWQETWLKAWKGFASFQGKCSVKTWVTRIAINTCREIRRSAWFRFEHHATDSEVILNTVAADVPPEYGVMDAIHALPMRYREAITLYYMEDMSIKELSEVLGVSQNTAASRLRRSRIKLKTILQGGMNCE